MADARLPQRHEPRRPSEAQSGCYDPDVHSFGGLPAQEVVEPASVLSAQEAGCFDVDCALRARQRLHQGGHAFAGGPMELHVVPGGVDVRSGTAQGGDHPRAVLGDIVGFADHVPLVGPLLPFAVPAHVDRRSPEEIQDEPQERQHEHYRHPEDERPRVEALLEQEQIHREQIDGEPCRPDRRYREYVREERYGEICHGGIPRFTYPRRALPSS